MVGNLIYVGIVLFIIAIIAYVLGAQGVAGMTASLGKTLLIIGVVLAIILILIGVLTGRSPAVGAFELIPAVGSIASALPLGLLG